jgi:hypothetical protein
VIKKVKGRYQVVSSKSKNLGGPYKTLELAKGRLRQVEFFSSVIARDNPARNESVREIRDEKLKNRSCWENYPEEATEPQPAQITERASNSSFREPCAEECEKTNLAQLAAGGELSLRLADTPWHEQLENSGDTADRLSPHILLTFPRAKTSA